MQGKRTHGFKSNCSCIRTYQLNAVMFESCLVCEDLPVSYDVKMRHCLVWPHRGYTYRLWSIAQRLNTDSHSERILERGLVHENILGWMGGFLAYRWHLRHWMRVIKRFIFLPSWMKPLESTCPSALQVFRGLEDLFSLRATILLDP